jgi:hypothetical protein
VGISAIKNKMLKDMEEFSHELNVAKQSISNAQTNILTAMREKMMTMQLSPGKYGAGGSPGRNTLSRTAAAAAAELFDSKQLESANQTDMATLLQEAGVSSLDELLAALDTSEDQVFALYSDTQLKEDEMERIEVENKHLEQQVELQVPKRVNT